MHKKKKRTALFLLDVKAHNLPYKHSMHSVVSTRSNTQVQGLGDRPYM